MRTLSRAKMAAFCGDSLRSTSWNPITPSENGNAASTLATGSASASSAYGAARWYFAVTRVTVLFAIRVLDPCRDDARVETTDLDSDNTSNAVDRQPRYVGIVVGSGR